MKRKLIFALLTLASLASATPPAAEGAQPNEVTPAAKSIVQKELTKPLAAKEEARSRFSRAILPAQARRIRVLDEQLKKDAKGHAFVTFAVDARHGYGVSDDEEAKESAWRKDTIVGCVYADSGEVFVKKGDEFRPASIMLGKKTKPAAKHICQSETTQLVAK